MTGKLFGVLRMHALILGIGTSGLRFAIRWNRSGKNLLSSVSKSVGAAVTAGVPSVGSVGTSVDQHLVQQLSELEEDEDLEEADDDALEEGEESILTLVVCEAVLSEAGLDGPSSGSVSSARVPRSSRRSSVKSGSCVFSSRLSCNEFKTSSAQSTILVISPARFSRPVKGFNNLLILLLPQHESVISVPPSSRKRSVVFLMLFSSS